VSEREPIRFFSDGQRLDGELWHPPSSACSAVVVACSGYLGLKGLQPARFARGLVPRGYACLCFDYRGFGFSDGERGRLLPSEQVEDIRAVVDYLCSRDDTGAVPVVLLGWGLGGALVIAEAAQDSRVAAVVALNAIADGYRTTRALHDDASWAELIARLERDRVDRLRYGRSALIPAFEVVRLRGSTRDYVESELSKEAGFGFPITCQAGEHLLRFSVEHLVGRIAPRPLFIAHGTANDLYSPEEAHRLYRLAGEPRELHLLDGAGHSEWMYDGHQTFRQLIGLITDFLQRSLEGHSDRPPSKGASVEPGKESRDSIDESRP
jgi:alpha-beta hydrolase superfamily lysophospholipase